MTRRLHAVAAVATTTGILSNPVRLPRLGTSRLAGFAPADLAEHLGAYGERPRCDVSLIDVIAEIELAGRGGAAFPSARKWRAVAAAASGAVIVANGAEGEALSGKDAALLLTQPHLVLDGIASAAEALDADDAIVWLHSAEALSAVTAAIAERDGLDPVRIRVVSGPDRYLSGESSAVIRALSGGPALPEFRRTPSAWRGVNGRPTLLHNVETLARVALAARFGTDAPRTTLLTVLRGSDRVAVEVDEETPLGAAVASVTGPRFTPPHAVLLGGYGGVWMPWHDVSGVAVNEKAMRAAGATLGAGIVAGLPEQACGVAETARIAGYLAASSARQCGPCMFGLPAIAEIVTDLAQSRLRPLAVRRLDRFLAEVDGRGACNHPDGAVRLVASALRVFAEDVHAHRRGKRCLHGGDREIIPVPEV